MERHDAAKPQKHRRVLRQKKYTWEMHGQGRCVSVEASREQFGSWEEASRVGSKALKQFLHAR